MTEKKEHPKGLVNTYNGFIKDNPEENVFLTRHKREEGGDLMCLVTTVKVFKQMFPSAPTDPKMEAIDGECSKTVSSPSGKPVIITKK